MPTEPGGPNGVTVTAGLPVTDCHRALPGKLKIENRDKKKKRPRLGGKQTKKK